MSPYLSRLNSNENCNNNNNNNSTLILSNLTPLLISTSALWIYLSRSTRFVHVWSLLITLCDVDPNISNNICFHYKTQIVSQIQIGMVLDLARNIIAFQGLHGHPGHWHVWERTGRSYLKTFCDLVSYSHMKTRK